jgi:hypothetical protein
MRCIAGWMATFSIHSTDLTTYSTGMSGLWVNLQRGFRKISLRILQVLPVLRAVWQRRAGRGWGWPRAGSTGPGLKQLSRERVGQETGKLLLARRASDGIGDMNEAGVSEVLFGERPDAELVARVAAIDEANGLRQRTCR